MNENFLFFPRWSPRRALPGEICHEDEKQKNRARETSGSRPGAELDRSRMAEGPAKRKPNIETAPATTERQVCRADFSLLGIENERRVATQTFGVVAATDLNGTRRTRIRICQRSILQTHLLEYSV